MIGAMESGTAASPTTQEMRRALEGCFGQAVTALRRERSVMSSSFAIEVLDIELSDGGKVEAVFKNVGPAGLFGDAIAAKPGFLLHPHREIQVYEAILPPLRLGTASLYGAVVDREVERYWLFLEKVSGEELYQIGEFDIWLEAARWLARLHGLPECSAERARNLAPALLDHDSRFRRKWFERANANTGGMLNDYENQYETVAETLLRSPRSFIHGEFYASNILLRLSGPAQRICPIDWEMAGVGPGMLDVAALASGSWSESERLRILEAYLSELPERLQPGEAEATFMCCRLQIALQWLGWSAEWSPPAEQERNWLLEAQTLFSAIG